MGIFYFRCYFVFFIYSLDDWTLKPSTGQGSQRAEALNWSGDTSVMPRPFSPTDSAYSSRRTFCKSMWRNSAGYDEDSVVAPFLDENTGARFSINAVIDSCASGI